MRRINFEAALAALDADLHREVRIQINFRGTFGSAIVEGKLTRVEYLRPDGAVVAIMLDDRQSLMLDSFDAEVLAIDMPEGESLLRFHLPSGVEATVEPIPSATRSRLPTA